MQDVIFNGSSLRKPVARASVELIFDNSLGRAAGHWSQYAEVSVRRVLARDGESSYFINNTHVRRRDVHDIFLGTGLGPRAYAIIEQGMISRIIEARPEDLRVFLEEAAGISKYKERRRETEHRLESTRENLARVDDIRRELALQVEKLAHQAEVAQRYNEFAAERQLKQNLLWFLRKSDAEAEAQRHAREIEKTGIELEAEIAHLREIESGLEHTRAAHFAAGDALNVAQGELYSANSEVSRLEGELRFVVDTRQRIEVQLEQLRAQQDAGERQEAELREAAQMWQGRLSQARERLDSARRRLAEDSERLPQAAQVFREAQDRLETQRQMIAQSEQIFQVEQAHLAHARKALDGLNSREERLIAEGRELAAPDAVELERLQAELEVSSAELARQEALLAQVEQGRGGAEASRQAAQEQLQALEREFSGIEAKLLTLQQIQNQVDENEQTHDWVERNRLAGRSRLWQKIRVERGWEAAFESVLREKLHALELHESQALERLLDDPPPSKLAAFMPGDGPEPQTVAGLRPLADMVVALETGIAPVVRAWLHGYYAAEGTPTRASRMDLPPGAVLVSRDGHQYDRFSVVFHAPEPGDSGVLARQQEIEALALDARQRQDHIDSARRELASLESALSEHDEGLATLRAAGAALKQRHHERQIEQLRLIQEQDRYAERRSQIEREQEEIAQLKSVERTNEAASEAKAELEKQRLEALCARLEELVVEHDAAESSLEAQRSALQQAQREVQTAEFEERECLSKINEIERSLKVLTEQISTARKQLESLQGELGGLHDEGLREALQQALEGRVRCEQQLAAARSGQENIAGELRSAEESKFACEQKLQPLRDRIGELRLKEQAARLGQEQFAAQLAEAGADETALAGALKQGQKAAPLQGEITRLTNAIAELGAINMAALEELTASRERQQYLDAQSADLSEALETLEGAIRKIDRETRELLQKTFDAVNGHFGVLFPALFGGGEARLSMTGEEVLDCGVEVIARPPGKKNSTIHLLSGGEKALTAIALVFAMFQLNPAPFCLLDEVDAPLDDTNTERFCDLVREMARQTQFLFISHNKITMELAGQLIGVTMQEQGVSRLVAVDIDEALKLREEVAA